MLKAMRKNVKSLAPTLWIVIAAFIVAIFAVWGGAGRLGEGAGSDTIVKIGRHKISTEAYFQTLRQRLEGMKAEFKELNKSLIQQLNIPQQVLEQMIQQQLLLQLANEMDIRADRDELREKIMSYFERDGKFVGYEEYKKILAWNRISVSDFEESLKKDIVLNKVVQLLTAGITVTEDELWENYKIEKETARLEYVVLEESKVELQDKPSPEELEEYFEKNNEKYMIPEKREGTLVFLPLDELKKEVELSESEIEKYYRDNLDQFKIPEEINVSRIYLAFGSKDRGLVQAEAGDILAKIKQGEDFAELARKHSQDDKASDGGQWGAYEWRSLDPKEQEEIRKLDRGTTSDIIALDEGLSILKVTEKEQEKTKTMDEVRGTIKGILEDQKARAIGDERISQLQKSSRKEKSLDAAAQKNSLPQRSTGLLKEGEALEEIDTSGVISQTLFQLQDKEISSPLYTYQGIGLVQLEKTEPPRKASLEEVREDVEKDIIESRKKDKILEQIKEARRGLEGKDWEDNSAKYDLEYKTINEHKREQYVSVVGENPEFDRLAFSLPLNETSDPIAFDKGFALLKVLDRKEVIREDFEKERDAERENLLELKRNKFLQSYLFKLREEHEVKIRYDNFLRTSSDVLSRYEEISE